MKTIARSANSDIFLTPDGQLAMCDGKTCQAQVIEAAIRTVTGELQLDVEQGIPYFDTVFLRASLEEDWADEVTRRILEFSWVTGIPKFEHEFNSVENILKYSIEIDTEEAETTLGGVLSFSSVNTGEPEQGGTQMESLVDANGNFYLPVYKENGIQKYRKMTQITDGYGATTQLSIEVYKKDSSGNFIQDN